jgi:lipoprotein-releasing system permease protein
MQIKTPFDADIISEGLSAYLNNDELKLLNWKEENADLLSALNGQSISSLMIQVFVMVSVSLAIASVLAISVVQKSKQLGILIGAIFGALFGIGLIWMFTTFAVNPDGASVVPIYLNYDFIFLSMGIAIASAIISATIPGSRSAKLSPIEVIRNG